MTTQGPLQLGIPEAVLGDPDARELARVFTSQGHQFYVLDVAQFRDEPGVWGLFALDIMKHAARAYQQLTGQPKEETYQRVLAGFMAEMQHPSEPL